MTVFKRKIPEYKELIDYHLINILPDSNQSPKDLNQAMSYSVMNGGKRIRPMLTLSSAK